MHNDVLEPLRENHERLREILRRLGSSVEKVERKDPEVAELMGKAKSELHVADFLVAELESLEEPPRAKENDDEERRPRVSARQLLMRLRGPLWRIPQMLTQSP